jgi:Bacterial Ig-like domain (group 3)/Autotransporter beta-domain
VGDEQFLCREASPYFLADAEQFNLTLAANGREWIFKEVRGGSGGEPKMALLGRMLAFVFLVTVCVPLHRAHAQTVAATTTTLTSSLNPSFVGDNVTFTARVTSPGGTPSGVVQFRVNGRLVATVPLDASGVAIFATQTFVRGNNAVSATYPGDAAYGASASSLVQVALQKTTTTTIVSSRDVSFVGDSVTFTASVTSPNGQPQGTVRFLVNRIFYAEVNLDGAGVAVFTTSELPIGDNQIRANYSGTTVFRSSNSTVRHFVNPRTTATATAVTSSQNPSIIGQTVTFTATVSSAVGTPTGTVEFFLGPALLGSSSLSNGVATFNTSTLGVGVHSISARYLGSASHLPSTSPEITQTVNTAPSTTSLVSSQNPSILGKPVTFTATVTSAAGTPGGTVAFYDGATLLGTGTLASSVATFTTSTLAVGAHPISARYLGAGIFAASTSTVLNQTVDEDYSSEIDQIQEAATAAAAQLASDMITDSVAEEISSALSGQVNVMSASDGQIGFVYTPGMGNGTFITPTADLASGKTDFGSWRIWTGLRHADVDSGSLEGDQVNALIGTTFLFGDGLVAGLVAGYENQDYQHVAGGTLKGEGFNAGGYVGGALAGGLHFDAQAHVSLLDYDLASGPVTGRTNGTRLIVGGGLAHSVRFDAFTIEPMARASGTWEWQDGYADSIAALHAARSFHFGKVSAGAKFAYRIDLEDGASLTPFVTGFGEYRFSGGDLTTEALLDGLSARAGLGVDLRTSSGITASALAEFYGLGLDDNTTVKSFKAQLAIPF